MTELEAMLLIKAAGRVAPDISYLLNTVTMLAPRTVALFGSETAERRYLPPVLDREERLAIAAECIGLGEAAIAAGVEYANDREVFDRLIGRNQAIQHPLAEAFAHAMAAKQVVYGATELIHDADRTMVGVQANTAKFLAAESAFEAADVAVQAHGGFGVAREYDVERYMREARLTRLVPITQELALNYLGTKALGLPRSY